MFIKIENKKIGDKEPCFIIAEAGVNHNGDMKLAKKLIDEAVNCGADAVKFQNFITDDLIRENAPKAAYQDRNIGKEKTQYQMLKELELGEKNALILKKYCDKKNIIFLSTAYEFKSLKSLEKIGVSMHKLASIDLVCHPLIKAVAKTNKPLILSTGLANEKEIVEAVDVFKRHAKIRNLILLQCNTNYPSKPQDQNLLVMETLKKYVPIVGFSDHTEGHDISIAAIAMGAKVIERHFTLDKNMPGPDHKASMNPKEFKAFVEAGRKVEMALGKKEKKPTGGEIENIVGMRKSICASNRIDAGETITDNMLSFKRPGDGLLATEKNIKKIVGKKARKIIEKNQNIKLNQIK